MMIVLLLVCLSFARHSGQAADWPQWRGPDRNGISQETDWTDQWPDDGPRVAWTAEVGTGFSSFAIADGRVYTMGNEDDRDVVRCLDANNGNELWQYSYDCALDDNLFEGGPTSTPTVHGQSVITFSREGHVFCLDTKTGKVRWSRQVQDDAGMPAPSWGFGSSPLIHDGKVIINAGSAGMALDAETGETVWESDTREAGYTSPVRYRHGDEWRALIESSNAIVSVRLSDGAEQWRYRWITRYGINAADPIVDGKHVFASSGYGKGASLLDVSGAEPEQVWRSRKLRNQFSSSVLVDGHLYGIDGDTTGEPSLRCVEFSTGDVKWTHNGVGSGSLIVADGRLIVLTGFGELLVAPASPESFEPTVQAQILDGTCWTTPALANGFLFCRNAEGLVVCLDLRKPDRAR